MSTELAELAKHDDQTCECVVGRWRRDKCRADQRPINPKPLLACTRCDSTGYRRGTPMHAALHRVME